MRIFLYFLFLFQLGARLPGQTTVLAFTWEGTDARVSEVGPDAVSVGDLAVTKTRLDGNSKGLAPSQTSTKQDLDLVIADDPLFDVAGIDISLDFQRDEQFYTLISRNNFYFCGDGLNVQYRVEDGAGGGTTVTSPTFTIEDDDVYRTYRFRYEPESGIGTLYENGTSVWTSTPTPGRNLYWEGDGDLTIGREVDATGKPNAVLDNLTIIALDAVLPVVLESFTALATPTASVDLKWTTSTEVDHAYFVLERSRDGSAWMRIDSLVGKGSIQSAHRYRSRDNAPHPGANYYRLRQVDHDGSFSYSPVVAVDVAAAEQVRVYPNPTADFLRIRTAEPRRAADIALLTTDGRPMTQLVGLVREAPFRYRLDLRGLPTGCYFLLVEKQRYRVCKSG